MDIAAAVVAAGGKVERIDLGGGLGIQYHPDLPAPTPADLAAAILPIFQDRCREIGIAPKLILEPGRSIVADTTVMLTSVNVVKRAHVNFVAVDAGFNVLARPMLYDSYHHVVVASRASAPAQETYTVVGPICETGDVLAKDRHAASSRARRRSGLPGCRSLRLFHGLPVQRPAPAGGGAGLRRQGRGHPPRRRCKRPFGRAEDLAPAHVVGGKNDRREVE